MEGLIAAQRRHMEDPFLLKAPAPAPLSPKRSVALEAAMAGSRAVDGGGGGGEGSAGSGLTRIQTPTSKSPSSQLQLRLKKAQEAFASMRESHD